MSYLQTLEVCGYIYKTTNLITGKIYIGLHRSNIFNSDYLGSGTYLKSSIKKHGRDNFKCEVLEWCESSEDLEEREIFWIGELNSLNKEIGYNLHPGGGMPPIFYGEDHANWGNQYSPCGEDHPNWGNRGERSPLYGKSRSEETRKKISESNKGNVHSKEAKQKMSEAKKETYIGEGNPFYGKKHSDITKELIGKKAKKRFENRGKHPLAKRVVAIDINNNEYVFDCIKDASEFFNARYKTVTNGLRKSLCGDGWYTYTETGVKFKRLEEGVSIY